MFTTYVNYLAFIYRCKMYIRQISVEVVSQLTQTAEVK